MTKSKVTPPGSPVHKGGRPRAFDRDLALNRALEVFWRRGYEPASIAELCKEMGINPPSLYAAFGNKAKLFMEAVNHYETIYWDAAWQRMENSPDVRSAIGDFLLDAARILTTPDAPCGCLVVVGAVNISPDAQDVNDALKALRKEGRDCFVAVLKRGVKSGQLPRSSDVEALASTINTVLEGMSLQSRDGSRRKELERIATTTMALLPANNGG